MSPSISQKKSQVQQQQLSVSPQLPLTAPEPHMRKEIEEIEVVMLNQHYFTTYMTRLGLNNKDEDLLALDDPSGNITGTLRRKRRSKL